MREGCGSSPVDLYGEKIDQNMVYDIIGNVW